MPNIQLSQVHLPDFGMPTTEPVLTENTYTERLARLRASMSREAIDIVIVYGDREHNANITYLCGYDPRFEEALLIVTNDSVPALLLGNEGMGYAELCQLPVRRILYQSLSLMGQDRTASLPLKEILLNEAITGRVGVAGWKYFNEIEFENAPFVFETPSYLIDLLRNLYGAEIVVNVGAFFM